MAKCPLTKEDCLEDECAWWVQLMIDKQERVGAEQGKCAVAWSAILLVELRLATEKKTNGDQ